MAILCAYLFKLKTHLTDNGFSMIPFAFPNDSVSSINICCSHLQFLSKLEPERYHCYIKSCCCFMGPHADLLQCLYCSEDHYITDCNGNNQPQKYFNYLPIIPCLVAMHANADQASLLAFFPPSLVFFPQCLPTLPPLPPTL
jgi:hypothetical protein